MQPLSDTTARILCLPQVKTATGLSRSSIYAKVKDGQFPRYISLGARSVGWLESEIQAWIDECVKASRSMKG